MHNSIEDMLREVGMQETQCIGFPPSTVKQQLDLLRRDCLDILSGAASSPVVVVRCGTERKTVGLKDENLVGSSPEADISIDCTYVSRRHCRISRRGLDWLLEDTASRNGTYINGNRISAAFLKEGDAVQVGQASIVFFSNRTD